MATGTYKKNHRGQYVIFKGDFYNGKLSILDFRNAPTPLKESMISKMEPLVTFTVKVLDAASNRNTAYAAGTHLYWGADLHLAMKRLREFVPGAELPEKLNEYWHCGPAARIFK